MKAKKRTVRKYYKYVPSSWTQPVMASNGSLGGSDFAVAQTPTANTSTYTMFTPNGNYVCPQNNSFILYHPIGLNITIFYRTTGSAYGIRWPSAYHISFSEDGTTWTTEIDVDVPYTYTTTTTLSYSGYHKYTKIRPTDPYHDVSIAIGRVEITATELTIQETTSSDYDFYEDVDVYDVIKGTNRHYYKYQNWTQPILSANNSSNIMWVSATNEGQGAAWKAFDNDIQNGGWITSNNVTTGSLNCNINEYIYIYSITITAMSNVYGYTKTIGIFNDNEQIGETKTFFTTTSGGNKSFTWTFSVPIRASFLSFYVTGSNWCDINEIVLNAKTLEDGTSSDYDFYKDVDEYKAFKI